MLISVHPKLPMRNKHITRNYYINGLGFTEFGDGDHPEYLMVKKDNTEIHFFLFPGLVPTDNYGQLYIRTTDIDSIYEKLIQNKIEIHPSGHLQNKPWGQREFSLLDPDMNLLTFGQSIHS